MSSTSSLPHAESASLAAYRAALTAPGAAAPALFSAVGRLPVAMYALATLLYVQGATGSFAKAGLVSAGSLVGVALGSVAQGRLVDRLGPTRPLLAAAGLVAGAAAALIAAVERNAPLALVVGAAAVAGAVQPALPGSSRALWGRLVPPGRLRVVAYNYEAISMEVFFILGPALAALLAAAPWPGIGLVVAAVATVVGTTGFALTSAVRATTPAVRSGPLGVIGVLALPGVLTVALAGLGFGLVVGGVEVGVPAVAAEAGSRILGGILISAWSVVSVLAGLLYALRPWPRALHLRLPVLLGAFGVLVAAMAAAGSSLVGLTIVMLVAGAVITPQVTAQSLALEVATPAGTATEAFGWVITAITLGVAAGQSVTGWLVERSGPSAAFLAGGVAGVLLAAVLWARRHTLAPAHSRGGDQPRRYSNCARTDSSAAPHSTSSTSV
ncbi:MAG: MFS transporter [Pseudonocardia sp.]